MIIHHSKKLQLWLQNWNSLHDFDELQFIIQETGPLEQKVAN